MKRLLLSILMLTALGFANAQAQTQNPPYKITRAGGLCQITIAGAVQCVTRTGQDFTVTTSGNITLNGTVVFTAGSVMPSLGLTTPLSSIKTTIFGTRTGSNASIFLPNQTGGTILTDLSTILTSQLSGGTGSGSFVRSFGASLTLPTILGFDANPGTLKLRSGSFTGFDVNLTAGTVVTPLTASRTIALPDADGTIQLTGTSANPALSNLAGVSINTPLVPDLDAVRDLGTLSIGWARIYLASVAGGGGLMFDGGAQILDVNNGIVYSNGSHSFSLVPTLTSADRIATFPNANITVARTDAAQSFVGIQTFSTSVKTGGSTFTLNATAATISGFGTSPSITTNGSNAFDINVGTGGSASTGTITLPAASNGWNVSCSDITTADSFVTSQNGGTTTTATLKNYSRTTGLAIPWTANDHLRCIALPY